MTWTAYKEMQSVRIQSDSKNLLSFLTKPSLQSNLTTQEKIHVFPRAEFTHGYHVG
jgi:hypothetical protein